MTPTMVHRFNHAYLDYLCALLDAANIPHGGIAQQCNEEWIAYVENYYCCKVPDTQSIKREVCRFYIQLYGEVA